MSQKSDKIKCEYTELVPLHKLVQHPKNPNDHPDDQVKRLAEIIDYQGMRSPIVVSNLSGFITKGHGRLAALRLLGWECAPVDYQDYSDEAQEYADIVADNAIASWAALDFKKINQDFLDLGPDLDIDMLGLKDFMVEPIEKFEPQAEEDAVPEVKDDPVTKRGDIWLLGNHRVMCGDSTMIDDVEKLMNGEKADCYIDPPYGISYKSPSGKGVTDRGDYDVIIGDDKQFDPSFFFEFFKRIATWGANYYADKLPNSASWLVWDKREGDAINDNSDCELAWSNIGGSARLFHHKWNGMIKASEKKDKRLHPTQKPIALHEWVFETLKLRDNIFDGYLGSGSTLIACEKTNRKCYGMELDPMYVDVIVQRYVSYTGNKNIVLNGEPYVWEAKQ